MLSTKWLNLQLFADASGDGAGDSGGESSGVTADAAGQQMLRDLGVPEDRIAKRAKSFTQRAQRNGTLKQNAPAQEEQQAAAAETNPTQTEQTEVQDNAPKRMSWKEIMQDEEYNGEMQKLIRARLKKEQGAQETLDKLAPALEALYSKHGLDPKNPDYDALVKAVSEDDPAIEKFALEMGTSRETAKKFVDNQRENERLKAADERRRQDAANEAKRQFEAAHYSKLAAQAEELKKIFPSFDLDAELEKDKTFRLMTSPGIGISVENAYRSLHNKEIEAAAAEVTARKTAEQLANSIRSNGMRPDENGTTGQAPTASVVDPRNLTPRERADIRRRVRAGEKISF